jgi:hypothetical protein
MKNLVFYLFTDPLGSMNVTIIPRFWGERPERADTAPTVGAGGGSLSQFMALGISSGGQIAIPDQIDSESIAGSSRRRSTGSPR